MDSETKVTAENTMSCLLCSSQENYCFNSSSDVFGLIEINQRKKGVSRWLSNLVFLDSTKLDKNHPIYICEVHYSKEDLIRDVEDDGTYSVKLINEQTVPCFVKLEDRALNNRINSFLFLKEEYEMSLNLGKQWTAKVMKHKFILILPAKKVEIRIEENLGIVLWENEMEMDMTFAIQAGYIEANKRILFWSRLRGLMKYFEETHVFSPKKPRTQANLTPKANAVTPKTTEPMQISIVSGKKPEKDVVEIKDTTVDSQKIIPSTNEETSVKKNSKTDDSKQCSFEPPAFTIIKTTAKEGTLNTSEPNIYVDMCAVKNNATNTNAKLPVMRTIKLIPMEQNNTTPNNHPAPIDLNSDTIDHYSILVTTFINNKLPNWTVIVSSQGVCALKLVSNGSGKASIHKALKSNNSLCISSYINGKPLINNIINKTPGKVSKQQLLSFMKSFDKITVKPPKEETVFELEVKQEKLDPEDIVPGVIPSFDILLENIQAFSGNEWHTLCIDNKNVLIYKVDIANTPKFKRYISINRNLQLTIFNNDKFIKVDELLGQPFELYPLTLQKMHKILAVLDETVFEKILRPSKYRPKFQDKKYGLSYGADHRVVHGTKKKHKCSICVYESNTLNYVKQHYEIKHTPPDRKCPECGKEMNETQLKVHARFHIKKVKCPICNKGFADSRDLKKHANVHTRDKYQQKPETVKPLSVQNSQVTSSQVQNSQIQLNRDDTPVEVKHEPPLELDEIACVTHPMDDTLDMDDIKIKIEEPDDYMEEMDET